MLRIIIAFPRLDDAKKIKNVLNRNGYDDILACNSASQAIAAANECDGSIVLCGYRLEDMLYSELYGYLPRDCQMLLIASPARLQECSINGIMCLSQPIHSHELTSTLQTMMELARPKEKPVKQGPKKRSEKEQKTIDDAKNLLMERNHLSESEAHKYIQKLSMDSGNNLVETAEMILALDWT
ncbi:MAG: ANTAR domain-containing protein [Lachnospiraceae bacterium]|nr:ANTAR domain-containing protein [Lachnospiraceae bacterium]